MVTSSGSKKGSSQAGAWKKNCIFGDPVSVKFIELGVGDGITVEWNSHQEDGAEAEDNGEEQAELRAQKKRLEVKQVRVDSHNNPPLL